MAADRTFILIVMVLAPLTNVKIAGAEPINFVSIVLLAVAFAFARQGRIRLLLPRRLLSLASAWLIFVLITAIVTLWLDWRLTFYVPPGASLMQHPPILTLTRIWKLGIDVGCMFALTSLIIQDRKLIQYCVRLYLGVGMLNAIYALVCFALRSMQIAGIGSEIGGNSGTADQGLFGAYTVFGVTRARGFFSEGGPFGLYIVSVLIVLLIEYRELKDLSRSLFALCSVVLTVTLAAAGSKASFCLIATLVLWSLFHTHKLRYVMSAGALVLALGAWFLVGNFNEQFASYLTTYEYAESWAAADPESGSLVEGRIAAAYVDPAILADHPLSGIGFGNYPLIRNNPAYSWPLPPAFGWDSGGLGLIDVAAEMGIPLLLFFIALVLAPAWMARRYSGSGLVAVAAGTQFWLHVFGAGIPFLYPYLMTALALGLIMRPTKGRVMLSNTT